MEATGTNGGCITDLQPGHETGAGQELERVKIFLPLETQNLKAYPEFGNGATFNELWKDDVGKTTQVWAGGSPILGDKIGCPWRTSSQSRPGDSRSFHFPTCEGQRIMAIDDLRISAIEGNAKETILPDLSLPGDGFVSLFNGRDLSGWEIRGRKVS